MTTTSTTSTWAAPRRTLASTSMSAPTARPAAVVLGGAAPAAAALLGSLMSGSVVVVAVVMALGAVAAVVDARTGRIPDRLVGAAVGAVLVGVVAAAVDGTPVDAVVGTFTGAVVFAGPLLVCHLVAPWSIGFGDVKLAAVSGAALGLVDARLGMAALCVAAGSTATIGLLRRREQLPLGPGLVVGSVSALLIHGWLPA